MQTSWPWSIGHSRHSAGPTPRPRSRRVTAIVAAAVDDLADALDANDHVAGQFTVMFAGAALAASAIQSQLEVGALSPF